MNKITITLFNNTLPYLEDKGLAYDLIERKGQLTTISVATDANVLLAFYYAGMEAGEKLAFSCLNQTNAAT